jgi:hypothetical protein
MKPLKVTNWSFVKGGKVAERAHPSPYNCIFFGTEENQKSEDNNKRGSSTSHFRCRTMHKRRRDWGGPRRTEEDRGGLRRRETKATRSLGAKKERDRGNGERGGG